MSSVLVYRDRLLALSEGFVPRQYVAFERLRPVYLGCRADSALDRIAGAHVILGQLPGVGALQVPLFRQLGVVPAALLDWARARDVRIVHAQFGRGGALALPLARALRVPLVVTFHGGDATKDTHFQPGLRRLGIFQRRWAALRRDAALFLCVSDYVRRRLVERGVPEAKLRVHHLGVPMPERRPLAQASTTLLAVGRLVEKKGFADAIEALRRLRETHATLELAIIGDGPLRQALEDQARGLPVRFLGWQSPDQVSAAMSQALALLVPSRSAARGDSEGLPTVVLEAQARGLAVVATRHAGIPEAVEDGVTGLLVPEGEVDGLAQACRRLVVDPALRAALVDRAAVSVRAGFDAERQSARLERLLLDVVATAGTT